MANWNEVTASSAPAWDFESNPTFEGWYLKKKEHLGENDSTMYIFKHDMGEEVGVWGSAVMDTKMSEIVNLAASGEEKIRVKITYKGKVKSEKRKGSSYKDFSVMYSTDYE